jgi:hypothetical protein
MKSIKNIILAITFIPFLGACSFMQQKPVEQLPAETIVRNQLVFVSLPEDFFIVPDNVLPLDLATATQKDVASWLAKNESRTEKLENKILQLKNYYISTFDLLKSEAGKENVIVVDVTKSDDFNKKVIQDVSTKKVVVPTDVKTEASKDESMMSKIKGFFTKDSKPEVVDQPKEPVQLDPTTDKPILPN